jgi:hypothetical protein
VMRRRGGRRKQLLGDLKKKDWVREFERGSTRSHSVGNSLWKNLWACHKAEDRVN